MPTELAIRAHWADRLWLAKGYDSKAEFMERGTCFACGMDGSERAHILARAAGGDDTPENLHILCHRCHKDSEYLEGSAYMDWLMDRNALSMIMSAAARVGFNLAVLMQPNAESNGAEHPTRTPGYRAGTELGEK